MADVKPRHGIAFAVDGGYGYYIRIKFDYLVDGQTMFRIDGWGRKEHIKASWDDVEKGKPLYIAEEWQLSL